MLPIKLTVEVRDNPKAEKDFNIARTQVVVSKLFINLCVLIYCSNLINLLITKTYYRLLL